MWFAIVDDWFGDVVATRVCCSGERVGAMHLDGRVLMRVGVRGMTSSGGAVNGNVAWGFANQHKMACSGGVRAII